MKHPAYSKEPKPSKKMNRGAPTPELPASGGAKVLRPGMNFAATTPRIPYRVKTSCVRRTHESGSSEIRQRRSRTRRPPYRPNKNQIKSASSTQKVAAASADNQLM